MIFRTNNFDVSTVLFHSSPPAPSYLSSAFNLEVPHLSKLYACRYSKALTPPFRPCGTHSANQIKS